MQPVNERQGIQTQNILFPKFLLVSILIIIQIKNTK